jgi:hypothetical protein
MVWKYFLPFCDFFFLLYWWWLLCGTSFCFYSFFQTGSCTNLWTWPQTHCCSPGWHWTFSLLDEVQFMLLVLLVPKLISHCLIQSHEDYLHIFLLLQDLNLGLWLFWVNFCIWYEVGVHLHSFACRCHLVSGTFDAKTVVFPLNVTAPSLENNWS